MLLPFLRCHSRAARSAGPGIQTEARHLYLDSGVARFAGPEI
jgi:hypothetical protein